VTRTIRVVATMLVAMTAWGAAALEVPYLAGRVNDQAGLLDDTFEAQLDKQLRQLEEATGAQVVVLTVPSLEGDPIEDYSMRVAETWKLGQKGADNGVLILIARDERRVRIEVGYGLEPVLTDALTGRIIDSLMTPKFRAGDFDGGVDAAVGAIATAIRGEPVDLPTPQRRSGGFNPVALVFFLVFGLPFINAALRTRGAAGWMLFLFLTPFFFAFPAALFGAGVGGVVALVWLVAFPLLRLIVPKAPSGRGSSRHGGFWGPFIGGGGGGFSGGGFGGGFSGGGGGFGGGGASGGW